MNHRVLPAVAGAGAFVVMLAMLSPSATAQVTRAQQSAMRHYCRTDIIKHCRGERPESRGAILCLQANVSRLSRGCEKVVLETMPGDPVEAVNGKPSNKQIAEDMPPPETRGRDASIDTMQPLQTRLTTERGSRREESADQDDRQQADAAPDQQDERQQPRNAGPQQREGATSRGEDATSRGQERTAEVEPPEAAPHERTAPVSHGMPASMRHDPLIRACWHDLERHCHGMRAGGGRELACLSRHTRSLSRPCYTAYRTAMRYRR